MASSFERHNSSLHSLARILWLTTIPQLGQNRTGGLVTRWFKLGHGVLIILSSSLIDSHLLPRVAPIAEYWSCGVRIYHSRRCLRADFDHFVRRLWTSCQNGFLEFAPGCGDIAPRRCRKYSGRWIPQVHCVCPFENWTEVLGSIQPPRFP